MQNNRTLYKPRRNYLRVFFFFLIIQQFKVFKMKHKKSEILGDSERDKLFGCMMGFVVGNKSCAVLLKAYCLCGFEHLLKPFSWQKCPSFIVSVINFTGILLAHRYVVSLCSSQKRRYSDRLRHLMSFECSC